MKKYRCPHCGQRSIGIIDRLFSRSRYHYQIFYPATVLCKDCNKWSRTIPKTKKLLLWRTFPVFIALAFFVVTLLSSNALILLIGVVLTLLAYIISRVVDVYFEPLIPIELDEGVRKSFSWKVPSPDGKFSVNDSRDIRSYGIYGIKFDCEKYDETLRELYIDGMVPVVFHEKKKGSNMFEVRIIGKKFVPKELLQPGSKFMVEDNDQFICRGQVEEIFPKCAESDEHIG